jgi:alkylation response protein AidB-like acyl-CoA dehydrogenase
VASCIGVFWVSTNSNLPSLEAIFQYIRTILLKIFMQLQGKVQRIYRDAKVLEIYEGTKEIEKLMIARELLGR